MLSGDASIPIARYGTSNIAQMKTVYRRGLGVRYGRMMQAISGVHFNYSFGEKLWEVLQAVHESREPRRTFMSASSLAFSASYSGCTWSNCFSLVDSVFIWSSNFSEVLL